MYALYEGVDPALALTDEQQAVETDFFQALRSAGDRIRTGSSGETALKQSVAQVGNPDLSLHLLMDEPADGRWDFGVRLKDASGALGIPSMLIAAVVWEIVVLEGAEMARELDLFVGYRVAENIAA